MTVIRLATQADLADLSSKERIPQDEPAHRHGASGLGLDAQRPDHLRAQRRERRFHLLDTGQGAHRSIVPVRRIFFCNCKSPYSSASAVGGHPGT